MLLFCISFHAFSSHSCSKCNKAAWECEEAECSHECSVLGYQHIHSFDGKEFEFHGADCSYTLVEVNAYI